MCQRQMTPWSYQGLFYAFQCKIHLLQACNIVHNDDTLNILPSRLSFNRSQLDIRPSWKPVTSFLIWLSSFRKLCSILVAASRFCPQWRMVMLSTMKANSQSLKFLGSLRIVHNCLSVASTQLLIDGADFRQLFLKQGILNKNTWKKIFLCSSHCGTVITHYSSAKLMLWMRRIASSWGRMGLWISNGFGTRVETHKKRDNSAQQIKITVRMWYTSCIRAPQ